MKSRYLGPYLITLVLLAANVAVAQAPTTQALLKVDCKNGSGLPRSFRTTDGPLASDGTAPPSVSGLADLHASGSAQFSKDELPTILSKLHGKIIVVDLRQESHGFLDGTAVSWYGENNWANRGKDKSAVEFDEQSRLKLALAGPVAIANSKDASIDDSTMTTVHESLTEEQVVRSLGATYFRLPTLDHMRPSDETVDKFIEFYGQLPKGAWIHFHCAAGKGRTTTFLVMYDMLRNGRTVSFSDIVRRQALLGGDDLIANPASKPAGWERDASSERASFLKSFYDYATTAPANHSVSWSDWIKSHPLPPVTKSS